ncbi:MAG TPA: hypothetical protein VGI70_05975, partial [Polyangiales bacterium]
MTCDVRFRLGVLLCLFVGVLSRETVAAQPAGTSNSSLPPAAAPVTAPPPPPAATATAPPPPAAATVTTTEVVVPAETSPAAPSEVAWDLLHRRYNSWNGPTGGLYLLDGRTGEPGAVRAQLAIDGFAGSSVFLQGDHVTVSNQSLSLSVTATENLEFFATLNNRTANETRPDNRSLDAIGDVSIG